MTTKKTKPVAVTRAFLNDLAKDIYDSKTRRFLRLCDGKLQNGPDPTNKRRRMHCGLGELYFAMTGKQPSAAGVTEEDVTQLALDLSPLGVTQQKKKAENAIRAMDISSEVKDRLLNTLVNTDDDEFVDGLAISFTEILGEIPEDNDDDCGHGEDCSIAQFRDRSKRVAKRLRRAAKLLPA